MPRSSTNVQPTYVRIRSSRKPPLHRQLHSKSHTYLLGKRFPPLRKLHNQLILVLGNKPILLATKKRNDQTSHGAYVRGRAITCSRGGTPIWCLEGFWQARGLAAADRVGTMGLDCALLAYSYSMERDGYNGWNEHGAVWGEWDASPRDTYLIHTLKP